MKMRLKISSVKWWPFCPGGDELIVGYLMGGNKICATVITEQLNKPHPDYIFSLAATYSEQNLKTMG